MSGSTDIAHPPDTMTSDVTGVSNRGRDRSPHANSEEATGPSLPLGFEMTNEDMEGMLRVLPRLIGMVLAELHQARMAPDVPSAQQHIECARLLLEETRNGVREFLDTGTLAR